MDSMIDDGPVLIPGIDVHLAPCEYEWHLLGDAADVIAALGK